MATLSTIPHVSDTATDRHDCALLHQTRDDLILTSFDLDEYLFRALKAGASGFLLKDVPRAQLVSAVRTVAAGEELLSPTITRRLVEKFVRRPRVTDKGSPLGNLTQREREVLKLVATGRSNREIAESLYLGEATVNTYGNVFTKCGLRDRAQAGRS